MPRRLRRAQDAHARGQARRRRALIFDVSVTVLCAVALSGIYTLRIIPLSSPAAPPPAGIHLAWAGLSLNGYAETVYVHQARCSERAWVVLDLYPKPGVPWTPGPPGPIALAFVGDGTTLRHSDPVVYISDAPEVGQSLIFGDHHVLAPATRYTASLQPSFGLSRLRFRYAPASQLNIYVAFYADWASSRDGSGTCWLDLPSLYDDGTASLGANSFVGHPEWARGLEGQPLTGGGAFVNYQQPSQVRVSTASSLPAPSSIDPPSWSCANRLGTAGTCQAFVALEEPGAGDQRLRSLVLWTLAGGLLLAFVGEALLGIMRDLLVEGHGSTQQDKQRGR
jgi:hypothetical protein